MERGKLSDDVNFDSSFNKLRCHVLGLSHSKRLFALLVVAHIDWVMFNEVISVHINIFIILIEAEIQSASTLFGRNFLQNNKKKSFRTSFIKITLLTHPNNQ